MHWRRATWILVTVTAATLGCATTQYRNAQRPDAGPAQLSIDVSDCRNNSMRPSMNRGGDEYSRPLMVVDEDMAAACLADRGWRPVGK